jgi:uncharacterized protein YggE
MKFQKSYFEEVQMKSKTVILAALVTILAALAIASTGCGSNGTVSAQQQPVNVSINSQQGLWVSGQGKVTVTPNIVILNIGVQAQASTVDEAQSQASTAMDKMMAALADNGVEKKDIQTQQFSIQQQVRYDNYSSTTNITGYQVNNMVNATVRSTDQVGAIIDAAAKAAGDAIRINSVNFAVDKPDQYYSEARQMAMDNAKAKAQETAKLAGVTLGSPTYVSESIYSQTQPYYNGLVTQAGASLPAVIVPAPPVNPGQSDIIINVQVSYSIQ